ncbi:hypothetical protein [Protofrankia coriariae]|uniref:DUF8175 domain-containing protein n=1 Tax=Protofrankia coriariae TaxID=1562887 RepID=A0ABR5F2G9_9ACTN|nr:hypothetical protein [Protofrankia coriariae]KLL10915.1 hypothetical protein FrCorBMG51_14880 [Protofrankia coriariae]
MIVLSIRAIQVMVERRKGTDMAGERRFSTGVGLLAAAGLVAVGIAVGLVLVSGRGGSPTPAPAPPTGTAGAVPVPGGPVLPDSGLPVLDFSDLTWLDFHGFALPVSPAAGPRILADDRASGFAHTPLGAALAAIHVVFRTDAIVGAYIFEPTIAEQATGADQPALLTRTRIAAARYTIPDRLTGRFSDPIFRYAGVRFDVAAPDRVVLYVATDAVDSTGTTGYAAMRIELRWERGDWRIVVPPGGNWETVITRIASTAGFQLFPRR